ncbi:ketosynthase chain-length factor [Actinomadura rupiterrae]|uniref:ketosynthase chain-length factor n=1 Tax=Actinomadura rupiterrae TaxID=559627 RepID=UPI0020A4B2FE|nr:ketosynthase chain-length factor [Actinomadura rupiterrae]MCP2341100.1 act minimal PKS chain-length factor (CLF/KS beta) [Actinomadura rupiterrae]
MSGPVVTGIGVVAPNGLGTETYWEATLNGESGIGPITRFEAADYPLRFAGEVAGFTASDHVPNRLIPQTDHWTHMGLTAAEMALGDARVSPAELPEYASAVVTASSSGGTDFGQREIERLWSRGPQWVGAYQSIAWFYAATTGQISIRHGMHGPCGVISAEEAGALDAIAQARRLVRGGSRVVVTGGTDASLCPYGVVAQLSNGLLSRSADRDRAYVPFAADACGYVPGEGGAMLVLEASGSRVPPQRYGEIAGHAATFDPPPGSGRPPGLRRAIERALQDASVEPGDVDVVFADAAGTPDLDRAEAEALAAVFGPYGVPVTAPKVLTGRMYAGAALDVATALLSIRDGVIPPTPGVTPSREMRIDLVGDARKGTVRTALVVARGYGGFNSALVVRAPSDTREDTHEGPHDTTEKDQGRNA